MTATDTPPDGETINPREARRYANDVARRCILDGMHDAFRDAAEVLGAREVARLLARLAGQVAIESGASAADARAEFISGVQAALQAALGERVVRL